MEVSQIRVPIVFITISGQQAIPMRSYISPWIASIVFFSFRRTIVSDDTLMLFQYDVAFADP
jgi:hypothetical protein